MSYRDAYPSRALPPPWIGPKEGPGKFQNFFPFRNQTMKHRSAFPVISLHGDPTFYPTGYRLDLGAGCNLNLDFFTRKLLYLKGELDTPGRSAGREGKKNPFAFVTAAHLEALKARKYEQKYRLKLELTRRLVSAGWSEPFGENLLRFLDWMLQLPEELEELYDHEARSILEEEDMPYVTSWERRALKQGVELGMKQGIDLGVVQGLEQGNTLVLKGKQDTLCRLGDKKFGGSELEKDTFKEKVSAINDESLLDRAIEAVLDAESREELRALLEG